MSWPGVFDPGQVCSFCGHGWPHPYPCDRTITVGRGKHQRQEPCPCIAGEDPEETS